MKGLVSAKNKIIKRGLIIFDYNKNCLILRRNFDQNLNPLLHFLMLEKKKNALKVDLKRIFENK